VQPPASEDDLAGQTALLLPGADHCPYAAVVVVLTLTLIAPVCCSVMSDPAFELEDYLLQSLRTGRWVPRQRLPTERELSEQFVLSRTVVRRVLGQLRERGLIEQRVGSGTYVTEQAPLLLAAEGTRTSEAPAISPAELMEARLLFEPAIAELVVSNATSADFEYMDRCCHEAEAAQTLQEFEYWDAELHRAIALATHNGFVEQVFAGMNQARAHGDWGELKRRSLTPERRHAYQREHRSIVQALRQRDPELARLRVREHLLHVRRNLLGN